MAIAVNITQRIAFWGTISYFAAYLISTFDLSVGFVALPLAVAAIGQMVGSYGAGLVANRRYRAYFIAATTAVGGVCGFVFFTVNLGLWASVAVATLGTGLLSATFPILVAASTEYSGESKATGVGLMGFSNQSGGALGAAIAGALLANVGYAGVGYMCLGVTVVSALLTGSSAGSSENPRAKTKQCAPGVSIEWTWTTFDLKAGQRNERSECSKPHAGDYGQPRVPAQPEQRVHRPDCH